MSDKSFAEMTARLDEITKILEKGDCSLEESVKLYDEGKKLSAACTEMLEKAKQNIEVVR